MCACRTQRLHDRPQGGQHHSPSPSHKKKLMHALCFFSRRSSRIQTRRRDSGRKEPSKRQRWANESKTMVSLVCRCYFRTPPLYFFRLPILRLSLVKLVLRVLLRETMAQPSVSFVCALRRSNPCIVPVARFFSPTSDASHRTWME